MCPDPSAVSNTETEDRVKAGKPTTRRQQPKLIEEPSGDLARANYWVKVGLLQSQVKALTRLGKRWTNSKSPCTQAARLLISLGLLNEADTEAKLRVLANYMESEGFQTLGQYCAGPMRAKELLRK